jgi:hypothetical protein
MLHTPARQRPELGIELYAIKAERVVQNTRADTL